jgi:hypothetical protein
LSTTIWAQTNKAVIENLLGIEVRKKIGAGVAQLGTLLELIGLDHENIGATKAKAVAGGKKVYLYQISENRLRNVEDVVRRRKQVTGWDFIKKQYGHTEIDSDD